MKLSKFKEIRMELYRLTFEIGYDGENMQLYEQLSQALDTLDSLGIEQGLLDAETLNYIEKET
jgi:hypothetical protein